MSMPAEQNIDLSELPPSLVQIAEIIGLPLTVILIETMGGSEIWIPSKITKEHLLVKTLGWEAAHNLAQQYKLSKIYIPKAVRAACSFRNTQIKKMHADGVPIKEIKNKTRLSIRRIEQILSG